MRPLWPAPMMMMSRVSANVVSRALQSRLCRTMRVKSSILQYLDSGIASACAHDAAAGMRRRSAHVKIFYRRAILRPARRRPQKEKLFQRQLALKNISFRQSELAFEIK